jgi:transposase
VIWTITIVPQEALMNEPVIERVDELPLLIHWLLQMRVHEIIDRILPHPHPNRQGLSYGQLALLFVAYVVYMRSHRLCEMEEWVGHHQMVLEQTTHWHIRVEDATDDRLGDLLSALGEDEERTIRVQRELGQHLIRAYRLPTETVRYDTTTFSVHHAPDENGKAGGGLLVHGHSKDHRPDLPQFKQGLGALDPAGVPIFTNTIAGNAADDPLYVPAWREMSTTIGHTHFLFTADCKAAALSTRTQIAREEGFYLFPLPMTGKVPDYLRDWVLDPPTPPIPIVLEDVIGPDGKPQVVGSGFVVELGLYATLEDGVTRYHWMEQWLVIRSDSWAQRQQAALEKRLSKAEAELQRLNGRGFTSAAELEQAAQQVLERHGVGEWLTVTVSETVTEQTRYVGPGRPGPNRPKQVIVVHQAHLTVGRNVATIAEAQQLAGWRIHVTNVPTAQMSLQQAIGYYRDEFLVERGMHRFKRGSLPVLPLFLKLPERIRGLMLLLLIALQLLTLLEFVAQRELARRQETIRGLVPGNPKMKTSRPSAERILARFHGLHWLGEWTETGTTGKVVEALTPVQRRILDLLDVPESIYTLNATVPIHNHQNST